MKKRISPFWWPFLLLFSPLILPVLLWKNLKYQKNRNQATSVNKIRIDTAKPIPLPEVDRFGLTVLVEERAKNGYRVEPGISYLLQTDTGVMLYDVGFGADRGTLEHNASKKGITFHNIDALAISHLHPDHMGGLQASRKKQVRIPDSLGDPNGKPCYLPATGKAEKFTPVIVSEPQVLSAGIASIGPLARSLFFFGFTEEQALLVNIKNKGLVVITGCGHPTLPVIMEMVAKLSPEPIYAIIGGLHFPITQSRGEMMGIQPQMILGTGLQPWKRLNKEDLIKTIETINFMNPRFVYLSAHDSCDYAIEMFQERLAAKTEILLAGASYRL